jgi:hypothetical protein
MNRMVAAGTVISMLVTASVVSCGGEPPSSQVSRASNRLDLIVAETLSVHLLPVADSVQLGSSVRFMYLIANGGRSERAVYHDPGFVFYEVMGPRGDTLRPQRWGEPGELGDVPRLILPAGGVVGRVVDLTCVPIGMDAAGRDRAGQCEAGFEFRDRGRYSVRVRFVAYKPSAGAAPAPSATLLSEAVAIHVF